MSDKQSVKNKDDLLFRNLATLERELSGKGGALPATRPVAMDATDDEILSAIDYVGLSNMIRAGSSKSLRSQTMRPILLRIGRKLGFCVVGRNATLGDLRQHLTNAGRSNMVMALDAIIEIAGWQDTSPLIGKFQGQLFDSLCYEYCSRHSAGQQEAQEETLQGLQSEATRIIDDFRLPDSFSGRLRTLVRESGLSIEAIASQSGISAPTLRNWLDGHQPRASNIHNIRTIARIFNVDVDILICKMNASPARMSHPLLTESLRSDLNQTGVPAEFLDGGDYVQWPMERRIEFVYDTVIGSTAFAQYSKAVREKPVQYGEMNETMQREWSALEEFKTALLPDTAIPRQKIVPLGNGLRKVFGGTWRATSAALVNHKIRQSLSAVQRVLQVNNKMALDSNFESCGLGILASIEFHKIALHEIARRRFDMMKSVNFFNQTQIREPKQKEVYSYTDIHRLYLISGLFSPETGWFFHNPPEVSVIPGVCDEVWVDSARSNWEGTVQKLQTALTNMIAGLRRSATLIRDPGAPIAGLIALDDPLSPMFAALHRMNEDRPTASGNLVALARHDRQFLIVALVIHTRLRRANYPRITFLDNNTGHLRRREGRWVLAIPRGELKNEHSSAIASGPTLDLELDHLDNLLNVAFERWLGRIDDSGAINRAGSSRNLLHGEECGHFLFPGNNSEGEMAAATIGGLFRQFVSYYLAECPWRNSGVKNVYPFGIHAMRDLVVTFTLKKGGSFADAARMIWDTERTVHTRYSHFDNIDRSRVNNNFLRKHLTRERI